jgi:hypothetical protein
MEKINLGHIMVEWFKTDPVMKELYDIKENTIIDNPLYTWFITPKRHLTPKQHRDLPNATIDFEGNLKISRITKEELNPADPEYFKKVKAVMLAEPTWEEIVARDQVIF